uniref:diacylglycerol O-acyltransferase n=1 Tax=Bionectria ochroleuca TaxID=29856 RepID=A0A8H7TMB9_BIOOC
MKAAVTATSTGVEQANGNGNATSRRNGQVETSSPEATSKNHPARKYRHVTAVHSKTRPSCLSHDAEAAPSFIGFRNLMVIVLVVGNLRLMIENLQKYGVLICLSCHDYSRKDVVTGLMLYFLVPCHLFAAYLIELAAAQQALGSRKRIKDGATGPSEEDRKRFHSTWVIVAWAHAVNITLGLAITTYVVYFHIYHPLIGTLTEMHAVIVWLKTASYAFTNRDLRHAYLHPVKGELVPELYTSCPYPQNITMSNLVYFWWAPTLVYQPVYPRTDKIRWIFVAKRLAEVFCLSVFIWVATAQYATPVLVNSLDKIASLDIPSILERLLKLSTISLVIWLAGFFACSSPSSTPSPRCSGSATGPSTTTGGTARAWEPTGARGTSPCTRTLRGTSTCPWSAAGGAPWPPAWPSSPSPLPCTRFWSGCQLTTSSVLRSWECSCSCPSSPSPPPWRR